MEVLGSVPVFNCVVYVSRGSEGITRARVANLAGIEVSANSERDALAKTVAAFKQKVAELHQQEAAIPWIDPVPPPDEGEVERLIPVHL